MKLTREMFLNYTPKLKEVQVAELGGVVYIRPLTAAEQMKLVDIGNRFDKASPTDKLKNIVLRAICWTIVDEEGKPLFGGEDDIAAMMKLPGRLWYDLNDEILAFSGMTKEAREELRKNLLSSQSEFSDSSSPNFSDEP